MSSRTSNAFRNCPIRPFAGVCVLLAYSLLGSEPAIAGGSGERVSIERLDVHGDNYTLVVIPDRSDVPDVYMGACAHFEVRGTYRRLKGDYIFWNRRAGVGRDEHRRALAYLKHAFATKQPVYLGWVGVGFVPVDASNPCIVRSRALSLMSDPNDRTWITSFHDIF